MLLTSSKSLAQNLEKYIQPAIALTAAQLITCLASTSTLTKSVGTLFNAIVCGSGVKWGLDGVAYSLGAMSPLYVFGLGCSLAHDLEMIKPVSIVALSALITGIGCLKHRS